jgi:putative transcriptional regulator
MLTSPDLRAPVLLLAMPQVVDPFFHRSVILLVHHDDEGSLGFILNRPTEIKVSDILSSMEIAWRGDDEAVAHFGGPVQPQLGSVLFATDPDALPEAAREILPGLAITQHVGDLSRLAAVPPLQLRLFLGYAGWGAGQLLSEIVRNDWLTAPASLGLMFGEESDRSWETAVRSVGVDPATLPVWTGAAEDGPAN